MYFSRTQYSKHNTSQPKFNDTEQTNKIIGNYVKEHNNKELNTLSKIIEITQH